MEISRSSESYLVILIHLCSHFSLLENNDIYHKKFVILVLLYLNFGGRFKLYRNNSGLRVFFILNLCILFFYLPQSQKWKSIFYLISCETWNKIHYIIVDESLQFRCRIFVKLLRRSDDQPVKLSWKLRKNIM